MLASTLSRPRWAMPRTEPSSPLSAAADSTLSRMGIADSAPSSPKRLVPTYFVARNRSSASAAFRRSRRWRSSSELELDLDPLDLGLDPALLVGVLDVHVLDADRAAVRVAQHAEEVTEVHALLARHAAGQELAVEVPDRQPVGGRVELVRHGRLFPVQRVEVGDAVTAGAVGADQRRDLHLLVEEGLLPVERADVVAATSPLRTARRAPGRRRGRSRARPSAARARPSGTCPTRRPG